MKLTHRNMMQRCVQMAESAIGTTYPNPAVGCVIVHKNKIIGEGFTSPSGSNHAEVNAINSVKNKALLVKSTLYVSLEPCAHYGKTPPCSLAILKHKIPKVVVGCLDSNEQVNGQGIQQLQDAGVEVLVGVEEELCKKVNRRFFTIQNLKRPYIILKWAQTKNGFFASEDSKQKWISNQYSKQLVHIWRTQEHAILVGTNTAKIDNPELTARLWKGNQPIKVLIDKSLKIDKNSKLFGSGNLIVFNESMNLKQENIEYLKIDFKKNTIPQILDNLYKKQIQSIIIEGGAFTLNQFIQQNLWDEARIIESKDSWESGIPAPVINGRLIHEQSIKNDMFRLVGRVEGRM